MTQLHVRGVIEPVQAPGAPEPGRFRDIVSVRPGEVIRTGETRGAALHTLEVGDDQVVEVELDGGVRLWTSVERLQENLEASGQRGGGGELLLPSALRLGPTSRGAGRWVLRALRLLDVQVADVAAEAIVAQLEQQLHAQPGMYRCPNPIALGDRIARQTDLSSDRPLLLFLHGTASSTSGSFSGFTTPEGQPQWERLTRRYGENIFALEHRTLSLSPIENALEVARLLPGQGAVLHLVSHSRGGLIGELLCRGRMADGGDPFSEQALSRFERDDGEVSRKRDLEALRELRDLLQEKQPRVERFVRVACPARGTTLASRRLDLYLSVMLNLIGMIPVLRANPVYEFLSALLLAVAKKRTDPERIPGLEAMMPTSPLIAVLNEPGVKVDADLSVIAGDLEGTGFFGRLKTLATDLFYRENHDLVVNTGAMTGGAAREDGARFFFDKGADVNHFQYFRNTRSAEKLFLALTRTSGAVAGFEPIVETTAESLRTRAPTTAAPGPRPVVFLLPGIMGSHLGVGENRLWIDPLGLARGEFGALGIDASNVEAQALVGKAYARLTAFLSATHEVVEFPFDWRRSLVESADRLATAVAARLGGSPQPVRILAHSMGGLVARAMIARHPALWQRLKERNGGRLVMLGTPNGGSYVIPRVLVGQEQVLRYLTLLDLRRGQRQLLEIIARFPGLLEMLPADPERDFFGEGLWQELHDAWGDDWIRPQAAALQAAREFRALLEGSAPDGAAMAYVAGRAPATPIGYRIDTTQKGRRRIQFLATSQGDGRVPWSTGRLEGVRTWYMDAPHGELANHRASFPALLELLTRGSTSLLPDQPPARARGAEDAFVLTEDEPVVYPGALELEAAALGLEPTIEPKAQQEPLEVAIVHGNLAFSPYPVAVGHYDGDTIAGAERVLDQHLEGRLSEKRQLNLYPGPIGTSESFLRDEPRPRGAIVVGLGEVGGLTGARLERSFTQAVLAYASKVAELQEGRGIPGIHRANLTTLLIGSGRGGIALEESMRAILGATLEARRMLRGTPLGRKVRIERLEFWELFEDVAIVATRTLRRLKEEPRFAGSLELERSLTIRTGGRRRAAFEEMEDWWDRLQVTTDERSGGLAFQSLTGRARAEMRLVPRQRAIVDRFLDEVVNRIDDDPALAATLFELLLPNELKDLTPDRSDLVLVMNEDAARYPWELLRDGASGTGEPLAVRRGLIRQLQTSEFRSQVSSPLNVNALVVGDPLTASFPDLPGAVREASAVAQVLGRSGYRVTPLIRTGFAPILQALFARPYRILHLAAHGVYEHPLEEKEATDGPVDPCARPQKVTGVVLSDGVFLQPAEIEQMRNVPELVFLNCCHLGFIEPGQPKPPPFPRLAANLATQLIRMGVRAVVAAGWAVEDDAAVTFSETFYGAMLRGVPFGKAVHLARQETHARHPGYNTWGAYQCYGDQGYVLRGTQGEAYAPAAHPGITCTSELLVELANLAQDADTTPQHGLAELRRRLEQIVEKEVRAEWLSQAPVRAALARAFAQLDMFEEALEQYRALTSAARADFTVEALEQHANLRTRWAVARWKRSPAGTETDPEELAKEIEQVVRELQRLPRGDGMSSERRSLIGSAYKRLSQISGGPRRIEALRKASRSYQAASDAALGQRDRVNTYPLHNWLTAEVMLHRLGAQDAVAGLEEWLDRGQQATLEDETLDPTFWSAVAYTESLLIRHLDSGELPAHVGEIVQGYRDAWRRGGSALHLRSVTEHLEWLGDCLAPHPEAAADADEAAADARQAASNAALIEALRTIRAAVDALVAEAGGEAAVTNR